MAHTKTSPEQMNLFTDWTPPKVALNMAPFVTGGLLPLACRIARNISEALERCTKGRHLVADEMSISKAMLDNYASEAKDGHNITLERFIRLVKATGETGLLDLLAAEFDLAIIPRKYLKVIEYYHIRDHRIWAETRERMLSKELRAAV